MGVGQRFTVNPAGKATSHDQWPVILSPEIVVVLAATSAVNPLRLPRKNRVAFALQIADSCVTHRSASLSVGAERMAIRFCGRDRAD